MVQNGHGPPAEPFSAARAIWDNREALSAVLPELRAVREALHVATGGPRDFIRQQWLQLVSVVYAFKPQLIIELGRGYGNSSCAMAMAARMLAPQPCPILSLCQSNSFQFVSRPHVGPLFSELLDPIEARICDIRGRDFTADVGAAERVFVFWDAHGYELAEEIFSGLFTLLQDRPHLALVHDLADLKYMGRDFRLHRSNDKWQPTGSAPAKYVLGDVGSQYEEGIALVDFFSRNQLPFRSAESSYFNELSDSQLAELETRFGDDFSRFGFWYSFSLNERSGVPLSFPDRPPPPPPEPEPEPPPPPPPPPWWRRLLGQS
jgi:hypothetical protein